MRNAFRIEKKGLCPAVCLYDDDDDELVLEYDVPMNDDDDDDENSVMEINENCFAILHHRHDNSI